MGLKQIKDADRIIFLQAFVKQILLHFISEQKSKENIEIEKLRRKFVPLPEPIKQAEESPKKILKEIIKKEPLKPSMAHVFPKIAEPDRKMIFHRERIQPQIPVFKKNMPIQPFKAKSRPPEKIQPQYKKSIQSPPEPTPVISSGIEISENALIKIEPLIKDSSIISIECPGPGKNLIVKRYNQVNITRIALNESEIDSIIGYYSEQARIPIVGGILKAAVGNSVISAVVSEFAGSRFIINKITPYSLIHRL